MKKMILISMLILWGCGSMPINPNTTSIIPEWWEDESSNDSVIYGYGRAGEWVDLDQDRMSAIVGALTDIMQQFNNLLYSSLDNELSQLEEKKTIELLWEDKKWEYRENLLNAASSGKFSLTYDFKKSVEEFETRFLKAVNINAGFTYNSYKGCEIEYKKSAEEVEGEEDGVYNSEYYESQLIQILGNNGSAAMDLIFVCQNEECDRSKNQVENGILESGDCSFESFMEDLKNEGFSIKQDYIDDVYFIKLGIDINYFNIENLKGDENGK